MDIHVQYMQIYCGIESMKKPITIASLTSSPLRVVIAAIAFGVEVDVHVYQTYPLSLNFVSGR